ncbi:5'-3' exonuclease H3TH domain-containing protein [Pseudomaricurvus hydrocarbonicus]|uniref:5'-3' exonuclease H3TH domain-containing protein n=1 Tax=Pseudomaricurvus hydrocarbonicus TaxID=1470433 RepID=UPI001AA08263
MTSPDPRAGTGSDIDASAPPVCLLDASIYIFRYYFSLPDNWFSEDDYPTAAVYGYTAFLLNFLRQQRPQKMAACFDESLGSCFRNTLYPDYKCSRALPDDALAFQLQACQEITGILGIACFASETYEADDLLGTLMMNLHSQGEEQGIAVLTRDKDLGQLLLRPQDCLWDYVNEHQQARSFRDDIHRKFGVWPEQMADYLALVGDSSDDIPGVPGIGQKTAQALLQWQPSIERIFAGLIDLPGLPIRGARSLPDKLALHSEQMVLSRCLADIVTDIDLVAEGYADVTLGLDISAVERERFASFCQKMGFGQGLMQRFDQMQLAYGADAKQEQELV